MAAPSHKVTLLPLKAGQPLTDIFDISQDVYGIETDKSHTLAAGRFSLKLVDVRRINNLAYTQIVQPNDLVIIEIHGGNQSDESVTIMLGLVVRVAKRTTVSDDRAMHFVEIQGQDCARWLYMGKNFFWAYAGVGANASDGVKEIQDRMNVWKFLFPNGGQANLPSVKILENILTGYIGKVMPRVEEIYLWHPVKTLSNEAAYKNEEPVLGLGERYVPEKDLAAYSGSLANLLTDYAMDYLSELWCDTPDNGLAFKVYYRRPPFDAADWGAFKTDNPDDETRLLHIIPDNEIQRVDLGRSDEEFYNFISVLPWAYSDTSIIRLVMDSALRLDAASIKNRGLRQLLLTEKYLDNRDSELKFVKLKDDFDGLVRDGDYTLDAVESGLIATQVPSVTNEATRSTKPTNRIFKVGEHWAETCWRWYSPLDRYFTGRIVIKGRPRLKVGHQVQLLSDTKKHFDEPYSFYVVGVSQDYDVMQGSYVTTAAVIRGQPSEKFIRPANNGTRDVAELRGECDRGQCTNTNELELKQD